MAFTFPVPPQGSPDGASGLSSLVSGCKVLSPRVKLTAQGRGAPATSRPHSLRAFYLIFLGG